LNILGFEKLLYHSEKIEKLKKGEPQFPVHATVSLGNYCNHRCLWCTAFEYQLDKAEILDRHLFTEFADKAAARGLKAVTYVGNGEPTAYPNFDLLIKDIANLGIQQAMFTNGYLMHRFEKQILDHFTWIRISLDAGSPEVHEKMHDVKGHYHQTMENIASIIEKRKDGSPTVGVQYALHHENIDDLFSSAKQCRDAGVDYFSIKPVFTRGAVGEKIERNKLTLEDIEPLVRQMRESLQSDKYKIFFRPHQFLSHEQESNVLEYSRCIAGFFNVNIYEDNSIIYCGPHRIAVGNIASDIDKIEENILKLSTILDLSKCPAGCRYHGLNNLWDTISNPEKYSPSDHRDFI